jgi:hypothetical protein
MFCGHHADNKKQNSAINDSPSPLWWTLKGVL